MTALSSSNLLDASYDGERREMTIVFRSGATYAYQGVDKTTYEDLLSAPSPGEYFYRHIRGKFLDTKVG